MSRGRPLPTWDQIAERLGYERCRGIQPNGQRCYLDHQAGELYFKDGTIHWSDRRVQYTGIRKLLYIVARRQIVEELWEASGEDYVPEWLIFYRTMRRMAVLARTIRVRIPHELGDADRSRLKALIANVPKAVPERELARQWTRR